MHHLSNAQREEIQKLAYQLWEERGAPLGSPEDDWFRAEHEFIQRSSWPSRLPFSPLTMGPVEFESNENAGHDRMAASAHRTR